MLLSAYRLLLADRIDLPPLVIAGGTGWGPTVNTAGLSLDQVITVGYVDRSRLRGLVAGASLLAFPSLYEGFGLPPLEAMAAGKPVIAMQAEGIVELLGLGALEQTAPVGDWHSLSSRRTRNNAADW